MVIINYNLAKCPKCGDEIRFEQKSTRYQNSWFHTDCLKLNPPEISYKISLVYKTKIISEQIYQPPQLHTIKQHLSSVQNTKSTFQFNTIKNSEANRKDIFKKQLLKNTVIRPDPVLVVLAAAIFSLLIYTAYSIFSILSVAAIGSAAIIAFYHLLSRKPPYTQYKYKTRTASFYSIAVLVMPFGFGIVMALDGYLTFMTIIQAIFVWSLALSFWQTMLFVPLAIRGITKERYLLDPAEYPKISVIVPAYNEEKVIRTTIESLLATDYPRKEIIVVDDGSKDKTFEIASKYKDKIKLLHKENGGKASALNHALLFTTGDIITIIDADTIIGYSSLKHIAKAMTDRNVAAVAGNIKIRNKVNWLTWCQALEYLSGIQIMRRGLDYFGAITIVPGALGAFRKMMLVESGTYDKTTLVEDFDATMKVLRSGMVISGSNNAIAYTQAPQTLKDFYKQRKRWYRGNLQVLRRHSDILLNPRFGYLHRLSYPLMAIHMLVIPIASLMIWGLAAYQIIIGNYYFVVFTVGMFIALQYLLSAMAVRMDKDDKKMILYSIFLVIGYKQLIDVLQIKAVIEEILGQQAKWTSAQRVRQ